MNNLSFKLRFMASTMQKIIDTVDPDLAGLKIVEDFKEAAADAEKLEKLLFEPAALSFWVNAIRRAAKSDTGISRETRLTILLCANFLSAYRELPAPDTLKCCFCDDKPVTTITGTPVCDAHHIAIAASMIEHGEKPHR